MGVAVRDPGGARCCLATTRHITPPARCACRRCTAALTASSRLLKQDGHRRCRRRRSAVAHHAVPRRSPTADSARRTTARSASSISRRHARSASTVPRRRVAAVGGGGGGARSRPTRPTPRRIAKTAAKSPAVYAPSMSHSDAATHVARPSRTAGSSRRLGAGGRTSGRRASLPRASIAPTTGRAPWRAYPGGGSGSYCCSCDSTSSSSSCSSSTSRRRCSNRVRSAGDRNTGTSSVRRSSQVRQPEHPKPPPVPAPESEQAVAGRGKASAARPRRGRRAPKTPSAAEQRALTVASDDGDRRTDGDPACGTQCRRNRDRDYI